MTETEPKAPPAFANRVMHNMCPVCGSTLPMPSTNLLSPSPVEAQCVFQSCGWVGLAVWLLPVEAKLW